MLAGDRFVEVAQVDRRRVEGVACFGERPGIGRCQLRRGLDPLFRFVEHPRAELERVGRQHEAIDGGKAFVVVARLDGDAQPMPAPGQLHFRAFDPRQLVPVGAVVRNVGLVEHPPLVLDRIAVLLILIAPLFDGQLRKFRIVDGVAIAGARKVQPDPEPILAGRGNAERAHHVARIHPRLVERVPPVVGGERGLSVHRIVPVVGVLNLVRSTLGFDPNVVVGRGRGRRQRQDRNAMDTLHLSRSLQLPGIDLLLQRTGV